jgi:hypothetical protein
MSWTKNISKIDWFSGYDELDDIKTKGFTENVENLTVISENDPFFTFLAGFMHNIDEVDEVDEVCEKYKLKDKIIHGYYHTTHKNAKILLNSGVSPLQKSAIHHAWKAYIVSEVRAADIDIYGCEYGYHIYKCDDYEKDATFFYKEVIKRMVDKL